MALVWFLIFGLVVGLIARAIMPGRQNMGIIMTMVLGVVGSFVGGFLVSLVTSNRVMDFNTAGIIGSVVGAIVVLAVGGMLTRKSASA
ncbi:MAG: GlsB/YeaQ/YmgE family stress response membrane protein [Myxococcota bacterium]